MTNLARTLLLIALILVMNGCVSRYSTNQYGNKVVVKDNELQQVITAHFHGATYLGKVDRIVLGMRMKMFVYEKGKDWLMAGTVNTDDYLKSNLYLQGQDPEMAEALGFEMADLDIRNYPSFDRTKGGTCVLGMTSMFSLGEKTMMTIYVDRSLLSVEQCSSVPDIESLYALHPEIAEAFIAKASKAITIE